MAKDQEQKFSEVLGAVTTGLLKFVGGASELTLAAEEKNSEDLYRARFAGLVPEVHTAAGVVTVRYPRRLHPFTFRKHNGQLTVNASVPWAVEIDGGAGRVTADLSSLQLTRLELGGGASHVSVVLPRPSGTVRVRIGGGASNVTLRRPHDVAARVSVSGGASHLTLDNQHLDAVGGGLDLTSPDYETTEDRYDIEVVGGASSLTVDRP
ncbi:hypothetical protein [Streptomyces sp. NPDC020681]|uniref:hypothetical protein n=1 Tax=Streptomyces sp. NPDC020681 TaxID=3365083 RepID=UPI0037B6224B